ncbi:tRNA pseudouridine(38-40) synthase TruA [Shigella flexneri]
MSEVIPADKDKPRSRWVLNMTAAAIMAGSVSQKLRVCRAVLEKALSKVGRRAGIGFLYSRTDARVVPARWCSFHTAAVRKDVAWTMGVNFSSAISISRCAGLKRCRESFHAQVQCQRRRYRYVIFNHRFRPAILSKGVTHFIIPLEMKKQIVKRHKACSGDDFSSSVVAVQSRSPWRNVMHVNVTRQDSCDCGYQSERVCRHLVRNLTVLCWRSLGGICRSAGWRNCWH